MYPLLPWKWLASLLGAVITIAVYANEVLRWAGFEVTDATVVRLLPIILLAVFSGVFAPTGYWAPWRVIWRWIPSLNNYLPDLNGLWLGTTNSNWPTIKALVDHAQSTSNISEQELHNIQDQQDAMAVRIQNSLFSLRIYAGLSSTDGDSYSITAKPWRHQHTEKVHLSYVYKQRTPNHGITDEESHLGAADLIIEEEGCSKAEGTYWTRRSWKTGRNTAGRLELERVSSRIDKKKTLRQHAAEYKSQLDGQLGQGGKSK